MGLLTDTDLQAIIVNDREHQLQPEELLIYPYSPDCLTPVGYDLRIGKGYASSLTGKYVEIEKGDSIKIRKGDTVLISSLERIEMPGNLMTSGMVSSMVSIVTQGITHISTTIDPDWKGNLLITVANVSKETVELEFGRRFCTIVFLKNESPATKLSNHPESRNDKFLKFWSGQSRKARVKEIRNMVFIFSIIPLSAYVGWLIFGNTAGMNAVGAGGITLSLILKERFL